ncbi:MAG: hypothetical protein L0211_14045 [Planctomycetaceae bacterium]|nr:hypothetical protein [Planctomycetaceae bacterium]
MFRRITYSDPHRPIIHLLVVLIAIAAAVVIVLVVAQSAGAADVVELTSGAKVQGQTLFGRVDGPCRSIPTTNGLAFRRRNSRRTITGSWG